MNESKIEVVSPENSTEIDMKKLQNLAMRFKSKEITEEEKGILQGIANNYIANKGAGDHGYYAEYPSAKTSYSEYAFYDLPNGLCLEGEAGNRQNIFSFSNILTPEEREKRIVYLKSTAEEKK